MRCLVLGGGGREHALAWKIKQSPRCEGVFLHPGNAGSRQTLPSFGATPLTDLPALIAKSEQARIDLVVIGPETLLARGYADAFRKAGFLVVGPSEAAARLETSKLFAKNFMQRAGIPTAPFFSAESAEELLSLTQARSAFPLVLKLDSLAAGKGVVIAHNEQDVQAFCQAVWSENRFGVENPVVVVEDFIEGSELSYIGLCDGKNFLPLPSATDYKRVGDFDAGPNTGGMGSVSPSPYLSSDLEKKINKDVIGKLLSQLEKEKIDYRGALYVGVMVSAEGMPYVLEFNARFGDPETQAVLIRLESDLIQLLEHTARGTLSACPRPVASAGVSLFVVGAAPGYPDAPKTGDRIALKRAVDPQIQIFYAGVNEDGAGLVTEGGRVLGVGGKAANWEDAREKVYDNLERIGWNGIHYRKDIGVFPRS